MDLLREIYASLRESYDSTHTQQHFCKPCQNPNQTHNIVCAAYNKMTIAYHHLRKCRIHQQVIKRHAHTQFTEPRFATCVANLGLYLLPPRGLLQQKGHVRPTHPTIVLKNLKTRVRSSESRIFSSNALGVH